MLLRLLQLLLILKQMANRCISTLLSWTLLPLDCQGLGIPLCHPIAALICLPVGFQLT